MVMLILVRDILLAVLLSWIGVDAPEAQSEGHAKSTPARAQLMSGSGCEGAILTLESRPLNETNKKRTDWFHS